MICSECDGHCPDKGDCFECVSRSNTSLFCDQNCLTCCSAIMDCLVVPLQEKLEDWKKTVVNLDKDHAKGNNQNYHYWS